MKPVVRQAVGYSAASAAALVVDVATLWTLIQYSGCNYLTAATTSYLLGAAVTYFFSLRWAFKQRPIADRRIEFIGFLAIGTVGLAVNAAVISLLAGLMGFNVLLAKLIAAGCTFFCNFIARRQILFHRSTFILRDRYQCQSRSEIRKSL